MNSQSAVFSNTSDFRSLEFPTFRKLFVSLHDHFVPHARNNYHPHMLSHRMLGLLTLLLMTVKIVSISLIAVGPVATVESAAITSETVVSLANQARTENNLPELVTSGLLAKAAQNKADDMLARQYFSHNTPDGATPWTFIKGVGYAYVTAGENLAIDFTEAESVQTAWMNSPGHRANILNKNFQEIGIGIARGMFDGHQTTIVVQMFGTPIAQQVELAPQPTPVAQPTPAPVAVPTPTPEVAQAAPQPVEQPAAPTDAQTLDIIDTKTSLQGDTLFVSVVASPNATKLLAIYGNQSIMLNPVSENTWEGSVPLANLGPNDNLIVQTHDINNHIHQEPVMQFSNALNASAHAQGEVEGVSVNVFGTNINPSIFEEKIFLFALALLITCLIIAIAVKRHVQHVSLVANTSFVAMLAAILFMV